MRKKKHPDVAYKSHEFFDMSLAPGFPHRSSGGGDTVDARYEVRTCSFLDTVCIGDLGKHNLAMVVWFWAVADFSG